MEVYVTQVEGERNSSPMKEKKYGICQVVNDSRDIY